ncbi:response regulator transcription factor [Piscinibacter sakaiensis]|uniref:Putative two-component system response regulator n=1 Tax=Piscinibacter sakaiensis TaxID=1547922 RepID=A0A0K8NXU1_PISS1|nr:response regulator transcription factor [Piscinibacter sakaiensis]GAP35217.1 putative two-component system response regulator [Piscinibacter sakaiensis]
MNAGGLAEARAHVLVVEDEQTIARNVVEYLELHGHRVDVAYDGAAALALLARQTVDVVVLDIGLPRLDGQEVLRQLRGRLRLAVPVLMLTARDALASKAACFEAGADDYLVKPFSLAELALRVKALHRRASQAVTGDALVVGPLRLDRRTREVHVGERPVHLPPRALQLLERLMRDPGRVVPRAELEAALWPDDPPDGDALRGQIHLLRRALAQAGYDGVETRHGIGWRLHTGADEGAP